MIPPVHRLHRRQLLRLGLATGALLALPTGLAGCRSSTGPDLLLAPGELPSQWLRRLPHGWRSRTLADPAAVLAQLEPGEDGPKESSVGLVSLGDGWASQEPNSRWQPLEAPTLLARLDKWAQPASRLFRADTSQALAFPWAFSPWVVALRSRPDLAAKRDEGWALLLDPSLRGRLVLPSSPRLCIELMGRDFDRIQALRRQSLAHDDRNGLNLLLSGEADAAVLPLRRLVPLLRRDQRLTVLLPASGSPLSWQLLLRPAASGVPLPADWMASALEPPLLNELLMGGWVPPLPRPQLTASLERMPQEITSLMLPPDGVLQRCWNLPPLSTAQRLAYQTVWDAAALP